ncbi:MAG: phosphatidate cytidylyltransferase [Planctomycetes bacterium]|nr:phosphatidate cytidylyltransferase [Planctomycetota bacterium]
MKTRVLIAMPLILILTAALWLDHNFRTDIGFTSLFIITITISLYEYFDMNRKRGNEMPFFLIYIVPVLFASEWLFNTFRVGAFMKFGNAYEFGGAMLLILTASLILFARNGKKYDVFSAFFGVVYICGLGFYIFKLRHLGNFGEYAFFMLILVNKVTDSAAYFTGKLFGRHKLAPEISPNKTVEGAVGGFIFGTAAGIAFGRLTLLSDYYGTVFFIATAAIISMTAQIGDLVESAIKRLNGVKDSGALFRETGGMFDVIDGVILSAPAGFFLFYYHSPLR